MSDACWPAGGSFLPPLDSARCSRAAPYSAKPTPIQGCGCAAGGGRQAVRRGQRARRGAPFPPSVIKTLPLAGAWHQSWGGALHQPTPLLHTLTTRTAAAVWWQWWRRCHPPPPRLLASRRPATTNLWRLRQTATRDDGTAGRGAERERRHTPEITGRWVSDTHAQTHACGPAAAAQAPCGSAVFPRRAAARSVWCLVEDVQCHGKLARRRRRPALTHTHSLNSSQRSFGGPQNLVPSFTS